MSTKNDEMILQLKKKSRRAESGAYKTSKNITV